MSISVVVCAYLLERFNLIVKCINSLLKNTYKNYEIILVVDNKELKQKIEYIYKGIEKIKIIGNKKDEGPSICRNLGIKNAKGDIIAFMDDDAFVNDSWLISIIKNFNDYPDIFALGGKILPLYENQNKNGWLPEELLWIVGCTYKGHPLRKQFVRNVTTGNMAVKRNIFNEIDFETLYNKKKKSFLTHLLEDTLFCVRLNDKKPDTVLYDPEMVIYHYVPAKRLKIDYIFRRSFSEGMLKAKLGYSKKSNKNNILSTEQNYLNLILKSIIKNFFIFKIRDCLLLSLTVLGVALGYFLMNIFDHEEKAK